MNKIYSCSNDSVETFSTSFTSKVCSPSTRGAAVTQRIMTKSVTEAASDFNPHWTFHPHQANLLQAIYRDDEVWRLKQQGPSPPQCSAKHMGNSEKKTSKFCSSKQNVKSQKKSFPSSLVRRPAKQIATALPASHVTSVPEGCNKQRYRNTEEDHAFGSEASLPLTGSSIPKKAPSLLQKMGLKLKKTVEYIGASNCAFEDD